MYKKIISFWPVVLICLLAVVLRLVRLEELFYFTYDESVPAFVGRRLILSGHIPLIGGATPFGFHLGPYFYWFYSLLLFVGKLNPAVWGIASALISGLTVWLMYCVGRLMGSKKIAITAAIFWSVSTLANVYDRHLWALYWGPLLSLITVYSLVKLKQGKIFWLLVLAVSLALGVHADLSNLIFVGLAFISFWLLKTPRSIKNSVVILFFLILSLAPLVVFDLRHDFANIRPSIGFLGQERNNPGFVLEKFIDNNLLFPRSFSRIFYKFGDVQISKDYSYCSGFIEEKYKAIPFAFLIGAIFAIVGFVILSFKSRHLVLKLISLTFILYFAGIQLYGTIFKADIFEHYLAGLFPIFLLIGAYFVGRLPRKIWIVVLAIFVFTNFYKFQMLQNSMGLKNKRMAIEFVGSELGSQPFSIDSLSTCWKYSGYRYLFAAYSVEPVKSYVDPNFEYLYVNARVFENHPQRIAAFVVHDYLPETTQFFERYALLKSHEIKSRIFGSIEVIILDNSSNWF